MEVVDIGPQAMFGLEGIPV